MNRAEADELVAEYDDLVCEYRIVVRTCAGSGPGVDVSFAKMNAARERLLDALTGEEATEPLAGNAP